MPTISLTLPEGAAVWTDGTLTGDSYVVGQLELAARLAVAVKVTPVGPTVNASLATPDGALAAMLHVADRLEAADRRARPAIIEGDVPDYGHPAGTVA